MYTDWNAILPFEAVNIDICEFPSPYDERLMGYKGVHKNMGLGENNYPLGKLQDNKFQGNDVTEVRNDLSIQHMIDNYTKPAIKSRQNTFRKTHTTESDSDQEYVLRQKNKREL